MIFSFQSSRAEDHHPFSMTHSQVNDGASRLPSNVIGGRGKKCISAMQNYGDVTMRYSNPKEITMSVDHVRLELQRTYCQHCTGHHRYLISKVVLKCHPNVDVQPSS